LVVVEPPLVSVIALAVLIVLSASVPVVFGIALVRVLRAVVVITIGLLGFVPTVVFAMVTSLRVMVVATRIWGV
jgi:hypothetical protein